MRVFIAFPIVKEVCWELERLQKKFKRINQNVLVTWVNPKAMHVTLQFLGDLAEEKIEKVKQILQKIVPRYQKFSYWLDGLDAFPNKFNPNIIVAKIREEGQTSFLLQKGIANELRQIGIVGDDQPWRQHVTIGRNKLGDEVVGFGEIEVKKIEWEVREVELIESELSAEGSIYTTLGLYQLNHG
ncbi:MAG: RNA 2',3'-cyclic phosphodiesterase [Patescibacteria group bacterium]